MDSRNKSSSLIRTFFNPGWILTMLLIVAFTYVAFTILAPWQLGKNEATKDRIDRVTTAVETEPVPYTEVFTGNGELSEEKEYRRVSMTGHYVKQSQVVLRMRPVENGPAFQALTPFAIDNGPTILVNRGWLRPDEGKIPPQLLETPTGTQTIVGFARLNEPLPTNAPLTDQGQLQVSGINTQQISEVTGEQLCRDFVQLAVDQPGVLNAFPLPNLDRGPYLSYGIQWIAFGILAPIALGYFIYAEIRERRREKEEIAEMEAEAITSSEPENPEEEKVPSEAPAKTATKLRSRYGETRANPYDKLAKKNEERF